MDKPLARLVSTIGHPAVLMPAAVIIASPHETVKTAFLVSASCVSGIIGYSFYKTRQGEWVHIDASAPTERAQLNSRVGIFLLAAACLLILAGLRFYVPLAVGLSGLIVLVGHTLRGLAKLSLHVAFAVFSVFLVWPDRAAALGLLVAAFAVGWSRVALHRHTVSDIIIGALVGAFSGVVFRAVIVRFAD